MNVPSTPLGGSQPHGTNLGGGGGAPRAGQALQSSASIKA